MKKTILLLICSALLLSIFGCQTANPNADPAPDTTAEQNGQRPEETTTEVTIEENDETTVEGEEKTTGQGGNEAETVGDLIYCFAGYETIERGLRYWWESQQKQNGDSELNNTNQPMPIMLPVLKTDEYEYDKMYVWTDDCIDIYYREVVEEDYLGRIYFRIRLLFTTPYEALEERMLLHGFNREDDAMWFIAYIIFGVDDYLFECDFPSKMAENGEYVTMEQARELLDFQMFTYSPDDGLKAAQ